MKRTIRESLRESVVVRTEPETGACRIVRRDPLATRYGDPAPPYHCTVVAFPDAASLAVRMDEIRAARDNAVAHDTSAAEDTGYHLLLAVHLDRPVAPGTSHADAVTYEYAGRGRLSGTIEGGAEAWTEFLTVFDRFRTHTYHRPHPEGHEIAWQGGDLGLWLEPDLETRLRSALDGHGLRLVGDGMVSRVFPGSLGDARKAAERVDQAFRREVEAIGKEADARVVARFLMADPAVPRMLRRLEEGCIVLWSPNFSHHATSSYQIRPGGGTPMKVSGERIWDLCRLGAVASIWEPTPEEGFHGLPYHLVAITETGRALAAGDIVAGVSRPPWDRDLPSPTKRVRPKPFMPVIEAFAAALTPAQREALRSDIVFPKSMTIESAIRHTGKVEAYVVILAGLISGGAIVTPEGRFKAVPEPKAVAPAPKGGHPSSRRRGKEEPDPEPPAGRPR